MSGVPLSLHSSAHFRSDLHPKKVTHLKSTGAKKVTVLEDKMESGSVPVETRINAILDYEVRNLSKKAIARKYGV
jgi:hypothetical protein